MNARYNRRLFSMPIYHASIMVVITDSNDSLIYIEIIQTNNAVMKWLYAQLGEVVVEWLHIFDAGGRVAVEWV